MSYSEYVVELVKSVYEAYNTEIDQVKEVRDIFVLAGTKISEENRMLIADFASKMPNSRSGQSVNQTVAEFVASPVAFTYADIRAKPSLVIGQGGALPLYILYICLAIIAFSAIVRAVQKARRRKASKVAV